MIAPKRKACRMSTWDYSKAGSYFLTFCTAGRRPLLGEIRLIDKGDSDEVRIKPSKTGLACSLAIETVSSAFPWARIDRFVVMPNHVHVLLTVSEESKLTHARQGVSQVVAYIKRETTRKRTCENRHTAIWQRGFHDRIVRNEVEYARLREYIDNNPRKWALDRYYCVSGSPEMT